ncbi:MAG: M67 family metallopeptidase [Clostridia bacterium]|nr:M67 family metallopeptidase [Clostridia bacterium]
MFVIPKKMYKGMVDFSNKEKPNEACGLIGGVEGRAEIFYPMTNVDKSPNSYFMDPKEQISVMKDIRKRNMKMVAIFHSHPHGSAYPSQKDVNMAFYPVVYLILSLEEPQELRGFRIDRERGTVKEVEIKIEE